MRNTCELYEARGRHCNGDAFARDVLEGLSKTPKSIPSVYFYDDVGSRLFQEITELDEYYLTRCEQEILETHGGRIAEIVSAGPFRVVELGAGDGRKTATLLDQLLDGGRSVDCEYVPIDICKQSVRELTESLAHRTADGRFRVRGIAAEYFEGLAMLARQAAQRNLVLFLGSSIGNFSRPEAHEFFHSLRKQLRPGDFALIGFDLLKDPETLRRAYDDSAGVTRQFNLNLLDRINRELGGTFDRRRFEHRAVFNADRRCMESWLVSRLDQQVAVETLGREFAFDAGEGMHVESSHKYEPAEIAAFAAESGFAVQCNFFDARRYFVDSLWRAIG